MQLFSTSTYKDRQAKLIQKMGSGIVWIPGNTESPLNYKDNIYHFRQDSTFRYFFGLNLPNLHIVLDCSSGKSTLYGDDYSIDDIIWVGPQKPLAEYAELCNIDEVRPLSELEQRLSSNKDAQFLPPYRHDHMILAGQLFGLDPKEIEKQASQKLIQAVVDIRSYKTAEEIVQMEDAVNVTRLMHLAAMRSTAVGKYEYEVVAEIRRALQSQHCELSYPVIFSVNGQTLHNHHHDNKMEDGRLVLNDSGAENLYGYAGDITRTFPVNGKFTSKQKEIYDLVLKMEVDCIEMLKPSVTYRSVHLAAYKIMLDGMKDLGLVKGDVEEMIADGVGGLFMPHGLGHMIGMDVHDMENLGEQRVGYGDMKRSTQLGLKSLRLARELEENFVLTVEPGIYFIPQLIEKMKHEGKWENYVNYNALEAYYDFGGVRIEDDVQVTANGSKILGKPIPKTIVEVEETMQN